MREMAGLLGASPSCGPVLRGLPAALEGLGPRRPQAPAHALAGAAARFRHPGNAAGELCWPPGAGPGGVHPGARKRGGGAAARILWRELAQDPTRALRCAAGQGAALAGAVSHRAAVAARRRPAVPPARERPGRTVGAHRHLRPGRRAGVGAGAPVPPLARRVWGRGDPLSRAGGSARPQRRGLGCVAAPLARMPRCDRLITGETADGVSKVQKPN